MEIKWTGQGGLTVRHNNTLVFIDPYFSDSVAKVNSANKRMIPVDENIFNAPVDVLVFTHNHLDHVDPETVEKLLDNDRRIHVLAPESAYYQIRKTGKNHDYLLFNRHTEYSIDGLRFRAVKAAHSDIHPIGVIISCEGKNVYVTGDTLYNSEIFEDVDVDIDEMYIVINGAGNNMNMTDAYRFTKRISPAVVVPVHWGMFAPNDVDPKDFADMFKDDNIKVKIPEVDFTY